ncbi:MAG: transcription elongation factor GreB [Gammaproteobacteria bacterium]|nr:transcription elongation factor GreB [Gammaproteobacteria bacterium]
MGRYRPPAPSSSSYITADGKARLDQELDVLWNQRRPEVVKALSAAAAEGDRSENAEYIYRKKELGEIDRRVRYLSRRVDELKVVDTHQDDKSKIYFGAWVELEDEHGEMLRYRIVGPDEFDSSRGYISMDSPMANALMRKMAGDDVTVSSPSGEFVYNIVEVRYMPFEDDNSA